MLVPGTGTLMLLTFCDGSVVPAMYTGTQFLLPNTTVVRARTMGATASTAEHSRAMALASSGVSVGELPLPKVAPPLDAAPDWMSRLSAPMLLMVFLTAVFE